MRFILSRPAPILSASLVIATLLWVTACGDSGGDDSATGGTGASGGSSGSGGSGSGGTSGSGGLGGAGGSAGATGGAAGSTGGSAGLGGSGGTGGTPPLPGSLVTTKYGCACDGTTDDSKCLQAALDDAPNWDNRTLEWPAGKTCKAIGLRWYAPTGTSSARYVLRGHGSTLKAPDGAAVEFGDWLLRVEAGQWLTLDDLDFDGNRSTRTPKELPAHNLLIMSGRDIEINALDSVDAVVDGLYIASSEGPKESSIPARITVRDPVVRRAWRNNISVINCDTCAILGDGNGDKSSCQLTDANGTDPEAGIDFEPNAGNFQPAIKNSRIEGCYIARNEGACVMLHSQGGQIGNTVRNNTLEDCRLVRATCGAAIHMGQKDALVEKNVIKNFTLKPGCRSIIDFLATGASVDTASVIRDNTFENIQGVPGNGHLLFIHPANSGGHAFKNNTLTNIGVGPGGDWCTAGATAKPNDISGNQVDGKLQQPNPGCP